MSKLAKALTAAAGNAGESLYVEDVFSTYLYDGVSSSITITNGIDLADAGGLVWTKRRATDARSHILFDSERGASSRLMTDQTAAAANQPYSITMNSDGYSWSGADNDVTIAGSTYASWSFRKAEKFFDVVTYTGDGSSSRTIPHNLNGEVGSLILKRTDNSSSWSVYHKSTGVSQTLLLEDTAAAFGASGRFGSSAPTTTTFDINSIYNVSGATYVAYLFASDAGGFGDDGSESIIKCGSFTVPASAPYDTEVNLGFEPQWLLIKGASSSENWDIHDNMRGIAAGSNDNVLYANHASSEKTGYDELTLTPTGFIANPNGLSPSSTYIYIAIRRPMKTPESGTEVFDTILRTGTGSNATITGMGFTPDLAITKIRAIDYPQWAARLTNNKYLKSSITDAETTGDLQSNAWDVQEGLKVYSGGFNSNGDFFANWFFKRATGFMDVVAYTGTNTDNSNKNHNLGVAPELIIVKARTAAGSPYDNWYTWTKDITEDKYLYLNSTSGEITAPNPTFGPFGTLAQMTETTWRVQNAGLIDRAGDTYIAYLFATLAGVSKVGSYTGTGSDQNIDCGFSAGARFVLIKRTSGTGNWYVYDSARGIVASNDPYLLLNSTAAEVTSTDYIDPFSSGFAVTTAGDNSTNINGSNYIFLAIA